MIISLNNDYIYDFSKTQKNEIKQLDLVDTINLIGEDFIYSHYLGYIPNCREKYFSCFQIEETASMRFYFKNNKLMFKDFSSGYTGDCVNLVQYIFNLDLTNALKKIKDDLQIPNYKNTTLYTQNKNFNKIIVQKNEKQNNNELHVVLQSWGKRDFDYWKQFNVNDYLLDFYNVKPVKEVYYNRLLLWSYTTNNPIYRYLINNKYKIYRPLAPKKNKWWGNANINAVFGFNELNRSNSSVCFITSSGKDVMNLKSIGYEAVAMGGETYRIPKKLVENLNQDFDNIILFLNNDKAGINWSNVMSNELNIPHIYIPVEYIQKDPSDFCKAFGVEKEKQLIHNLITKIC